MPDELPEHYRVLRDEVIVPLAKDVDALRDEARVQSVHDLMKYDDLDERVRVLEAERDDYRRRLELNERRFLIATAMLKELKDHLDKRKVESDAFIAEHQAKFN